MTALFMAGELKSPQEREIMEKAVTAGDPELYYAYICALKLDLGISPKQDHNFHQLCYRGRKMNYAPILNQLAITYLCGIGCKQNVKLAKKYFSKAVELGSAEAAENLDYMEREDLDFWAEKKYSCRHSSSLKEIVFLSRISVMMPGTQQPGKTTYRVITKK